MKILAFFGIFILTVFFQTLEANYSKSTYDNKHYASYKEKRKQCSKFLSFWFPKHRRACPPTYTKQELMPGLVVKKSSLAFDWRRTTFYSRIIVKNRTDEDLPANTKLVITSSTTPLLNRDGVTESGLPYLLINKSIKNGGKKRLRAAFFPSRHFAYDLDLPLAQSSNGIVSILGEVMVDKPLEALVSDPDGLSSPIQYQWFANGEPISGAVEKVYTPTASDVGRQLIVKVTYVDDAANSESLVSEPTGSVEPRPENHQGTIVMVGFRVLGTELRAEISDGNSVSEPIVYQWYANEQAIAGAVDETLVLSDTYLGQKISVAASYTDEDNYVENPKSELSSYVVSTIVNNKLELATAVSAAADGDWLGLASGDYSNMDELNINQAITLTKAQDSTAVIEGATCVVLNADKAGLVELEFAALDMLVDSTCDANGDSSVFMAGDALTITGNEFLGEVATPAASTYNWISVKGSYSLISRNTFVGKNMDFKGAAISLFNNTSIADQYGHVIEYNLFKDFTKLSDGESSAYALQVGRSTGTAANGDGGHAVRYNRFENIQSKQRVIKVQSSHNFIYNNTIEDSLGNISLENGQGNSVVNNIILPTGEDSDSNDGGISFTPYGHMIKNNYMAGLRTTSSQRGGLVTNSERFGDLGNQALTPSAVAVENNTIINSRQAINLSGNGCVSGTFIVNFANNLIANGEDPTIDIAGDYGFEGKTLNGQGRSAIVDDCLLGEGSSHTNEHYYSDSLSKNGNFVFIGEANIGADGSEGGADIVAANNGLFVGQESDTSQGVNSEALSYLSSEDVGAKSKFKAPAAQTTYSQPIEFDLSTWNITFPSGEREEDPSWLIDGNIKENEFFYGEDGSMVFKCPNYAGTTPNSSFSRTELREMLRGPQPDPKPSDWPSTRGYTKNNWVFSTAPQATEFLMGGVDGVMEATLRVDQVSTTGDSSKVGRVVVGQIHASADEPIRLYYRKLPNNELGSIYFRHEIPNISEINVDLVGSSSSSSPNPIDGVALGEIWSYRIKATGANLEVTIMRQGKPDVVRSIIMDPAYYKDWMYFKAGVYNQNNTGEASEFVQATFYSLTKSHDAPPTEPGNGEDEDDGQGEDGGDNNGQVNNGAELQAAIAAAAPGDVIEIYEGDYADVGTITVGVDQITLTTAAAQNPVFSGALCLYLASDDVTVSGLMFTEIAQAESSPCRTNGDASFVLAGDNIEFSHNVIEGDAIAPAPEGEDSFNWLSIKGSDNHVVRNTFMNKQGMTFDGSAQLKGGFITVFITGAGTNNTIEYNLFKDMSLSDQSQAYGIQLGRTTGSDSTTSGFNTIRYNRFDNVDSKTRLIRVQGGENIISDNTIVNSQGMIALEDGQKNRVANNIILPSGSDSNDGGISFAPYGHTIENNYIAGVNTTSSERGALLLNANANGSGNSSLAASAVTVSNNTILNSKQPVHWAEKGCGDGPAIPVNFDSNLIANGVVPTSNEEKTGAIVNGVAAIRDDCAIDFTLSTFNNESYYAATLSLSGALSLPGIDAPADSDGMAPLIAGPSGLMTHDNGTMSSILGADVTALKFLEESDVGAGSEAAY